MRRAPRMALWGCLGSLAFAGSCGLLMGPASRLADPMTRRPFDYEGTGKAFPVLVVEGGRASVAMMDDPRRIPPPPPGASYRVPAGQASNLERYLNEHEKPRTDSVWTLRVKDLAPDRQEIELVRVGDGYWGGVYEATAITVTPRYRKITGPGFAFVVLPLALLSNVVLWAVAVLAFRLLRRGRGAAKYVKPGVESGK